MNINLAFVELSALDKASSKIRKSGGQFPFLATDVGPTARQIILSLRYLSTFNASSLRAQCTSRHRRTAFEALRNSDSPDQGQPFYERLLSSKRTISKVPQSGRRRKRKSDEIVHAKLPLLRKQQHLRGIDSLLNSADNWIELRRALLGTA